MRRPESVKEGAACDLRAALATCEGVLRLDGFTADAAAAEVAAHHVGPPARPRVGPEPVVLFPQAQGPALCFGLYGDEARLRGWLPGLPQHIAPDTLAGFAPVAPVWVGATDHLPMPPDLTALPVPQVTPRDAGRYLSMGFVLAEAGGQVAVSAHRMLVLGPDRLGLWMLPGRALRQMAEAAHAEGRDLPVTVNIGVPPALAIASATSTALLPAPLDKLALAGGLAGAPLTLARTAGGQAYLARAEIVLEGVITAEQVPEALPGAPLAGSMPEFLGYDGHGQPALHMLRLTGQRQRPEALFQSVIGPGREQSAILGLGGALALALALPPALGVQDLRFAHAGGGMLLLYAALKPEAPRDLPATAQAMARICPFLKTVIFVDDDVSVQSDEDMLWAMTTRAQLAEDCHPLPGHRAMGMDPSQSADWQALRGGAGVFKSYVDATVPAALRPAFRRSLF